MSADLYEEPVPVPRGGVRFPLELRPPEGFRTEDASSWPRVAGRLEFVGGKLLLMPPCGDDQQDVAASLLGVLEPWAAASGQFIAGGNEAGMILGGEVRGADAALWRRDPSAVRTGGFRRAPPVLAVEIAGRDEGEAELREKARWYLDRSVQLVWLVLPASREVVVISLGEERRFGPGAHLDPASALPGLSVEVDRIFRQLQ